MTIPNAIKKIEKSGYKVEKSKYAPNRYFAHGKKDDLVFHEQDGRAIVIAVVDQEYASEDWAYTYCDNISQALRLMK